MESSLASQPGVRRDDAPAPWRWLCPHHHPAQLHSRCEIVLSQNSHQTFRDPSSGVIPTVAMWLSTCEDMFRNTSRTMVSRVWILQQVCRQLTICLICFHKCAPLPPLVYDQNFTAINVNILDVMIYLDQSPRIEAAIWQSFRSGCNLVAQRRGFESALRVF